MLKFQIHYFNISIIIFIIGFIYLLLNLGPLYFFVDKLQIGTIYIFNLLPILYYLKSNDKEKILPLFQLILLYFFLSYTLTFFFRDLEFELFYFPGQNILATEIKIPSLRYVRNILLIGLLSLNLGYFFSSYYFKKKRQGFESMFFKNENSILFLGFLCFMFYVLCFMFLKINEFIPGASQIRYPLILSSMLMIFLGILIKKNNIFINILYTAPIIFIIYYNITSGIYAFPFKLIVLLFVLFIFVKKRIPFYTLIFSSILFLSLHSIKYDIRFINTFEGPKLNKVQILKNKLKNKFSNSGKDLTGEMIGYNVLEIRRTIIRVVHGYHSLIIIHQQHRPVLKDKKPTEHLNGSTYKILLSKLIPRIFWKNKPNDTLANSVGKYYNLLTPNDFKTSWNLPILNESYANFNLKGVILIMFLVGAISRYLSFNFFISKINNAEFVIALSIILPLWFLESHLSLLIGAIVQQYLLLFIGFYLFLKIIKIFNYQPK